jgi:hypothetical protein
MHGTISALTATLHQFGRHADAIIASGISIAIVTAVTTLGTNVQTTFYNKLISMI